MDKKGGTVIWESMNRNHGLTRSGADWKPKVAVDPRRELQALADLSGAPLNAWPNCSPSACFSLYLFTSLLFLLPTRILTLFPGYQEGSGVVLIQAEKMQGFLRTHSNF